MTSPLTEERKFDWEFKRGAAEYRCGRSFPPRPYDENGKELTDDQLVFARWAGYMLARAKVLMKRWRVEDALRPDPHEPRPRKAA